MTVIAIREVTPDIGKEELVFIEIQLGEDLQEEDIIRIEDDYGRI